MVLGDRNKAEREGSGAQQEAIQKTGSFTAPRPDVHSLHQASLAGTCCGRMPYAPFPRKSPCLDLGCVNDFVNDKITGWLICQLRKFMTRKSCSVSYMCHDSALKA